MFSWFKKIFPVPKDTARANDIGMPSDGALATADLPNEYAAHKKKGNELLAQGMLKEATQCYRHAVGVNPGYAEGFLNLGFVLKEQQLYEEAELALKQAVLLNPGMADAYYLLATVSQELGKLNEAVGNYNKAIELKPDFEIVYGTLCQVLFQSGQIESAKKVIKQGLSLNPQSAEFHCYLGNLYVYEKKLEKAINCYQKALALNPDDPDTRNTLGTIFHDRGDFDEAIACYRRTLALKPDDANVHNNLGTIFLDQGKLDEAQASFRNALAFNPDHVYALSNLGGVLRKRGNLDEAVDCYRKAIALRQDLPEIYNNLGNVLRDQRNLAEAEDCYRKALALKPDGADIHSNLGAVLQDRLKLDEAAVCFSKALMLKPDLFMAHHNLGVIFQEQNKLDKALACYRQAVELMPEFQEAKIHLLYVLQLTCEWKDLGLLSKEVRRTAREMPPTTESRIPPFFFLALSGTTPEEQRLCAINWAQGRFQSLISLRKAMGLEFTREPKPKIHIGYFSADFREHAVAHLMVEIFEIHDRDRFQITAYSFGSDDGSALRKRLEKAFDHFVDIRDLNHENAARKIYEDRVDILVDLMGYTRHNRSEILALRPAPIQVNYLGYPGTMGASFVDYLIADRFIITQEQREYYTEKVVWLPDCYMPRDSSCRRLAAPSRRECGLPDDSFVFCSFNVSYKITPDIFDLWCRLLKAVPGSVLWLSSSNPDAESNLCKEAESRGVEPERIIRAPRLNLAEDHLARIQCADLFLDTTPYNAHTTCSDALWMGLPVVTCVGETFPSRVAGSLLTAIGAPELITYSLEDYYALALELATDKKKYTSIRNKIIANRESAPLFDSTKFTRNLEAIYLRMWDKYVSPPHSD